VGFLRAIGWPGRAVLLLALGAAGGGAAFAVASIPDGNGVIHGCVLLSDPPPGGQPVPGANLHITESSSPSCGSSEQPISWNVTGPTGQSGPVGPTGPAGAAGPGTSVTVASPPIRNSAKTVATLKLGTGRSAIETSLLGFSVAQSSGQGAAKTKIHDLSLTKRVDKASPALFKFCASGKHFPAVTITARKAGKGQQEYLKITMQDVIISSAQNAPSGGGGKQPQEHISLNFSKIVFE
jgi:type VI secretion system secreted protein Hcp